MDATAFEDLPFGESARSQSMRMLDHIKQNGSITTLDARRMGIMHPGMRICELRARGEPIETGWAYQSDETGTAHRVALYVWRGDANHHSQLTLPGIDYE